MLKTLIVSLSIFASLNGAQAADLKPVKCTDAIYSIMHQSCVLPLDLQMSLAQSDSCATENHDQYYFTKSGETLVYDIGSCSFKKNNLFVQAAPENKLVQWLDCVSEAQPDPNCSLSLLIRKNENVYNLGIAQFACEKPYKRLRRLMMRLVQQDDNSATFILSQNQIVVNKSTISAVITSGETKLFTCEKASDN